jgi:hypothetical protein
MKKDPGFIAANSGLDIKFVVSALSGQFMETTSEDERSSWSEEQYVAL